ncbi:hypothetical protein DdX_11215 [Ditylenchus destructor]|uniref:Uncharacterized protein n=1 Tax=Ditylenchus destructor TaxID=166010 RepID=A0AAD4MYB9_9BILA|nr:hypothetical protein DdX_11215 [Ditylenchus destructor]
MFPVIITVLATVLSARCVLGAPNCTERSDLISIDPSTNTSVLLVSIQAAYVTWNASVRLGFNTYYNLIRKVHYHTTASEEEKVDQLIVIFRKYNKNNQQGQKILWNVFIESWGTIEEFVQCGNATITTTTHLPTTTTPATCQYPESASLIFRLAPNRQIYPGNIPLTSCSCFGDNMNKVFWTGSQALTIHCDDRTKFCMCTENGECFGFVDTNLEVQMHALCERVDPNLPLECHMYAVVIDVINQSKNKDLVGDRSSIFHSASQWNGNSLLPIGINSPYLRAVSVSCDGCSIIKPTPVCHPGNFG